MSSRAPQDTGHVAQRLWSVDEHLADVLAAIRPLEPIELQLLDAQGCVLVEDVTVPVALPPFDNSSMDGYAVRTADVQGASGSSPRCSRSSGTWRRAAASCPPSAPARPPAS